MFGIVRFILAWFVVLAHVGHTYQYSSALAVYAFYMLSGFLMTLIMQERYEYSARGASRYFLNRSLRIYPQYWLICILTILVIAILSEENTALVHPALRFPHSTHEILSNIFIFGLYPESIHPMARLVPQAWALHVELVFYVLIGLFLGRNLTIAIIWFAASIAYHVLANIYGMPRYSPVFAASIAFSIGSLLYHIRPMLRDIFPYSPKIMVTITLAYVAFVLISGNIPFAETKIPFYLNLIFFVICLYQLSLIPRDNKKATAIDAWFGDLSYPIYLNHWIVGTIIALTLGVRPSLTLFLYSIPIVFLLSYASAKFVEIPIEIVRARIRPSKHQIKPD
jgi:peptidoglycan/LPS O-acetylase OafA/YrhL